MSFKKKLASTLLAVGLAIGGVGVSAMAANAAPPTGCSNSPGVPSKASSGKIKGSGTGSCSTSATRTFVYEIHRSEGWWHPTIVTATNTGKKTSYSASGANCDAGTGKTSFQYFGQAYYSGYTGSLTGNTGQLNICSG